MTKCIVYTKPDGVVAIIHPSPRAQREGESEGNFLARILARNIEVGKQPCRHGKRHEAGSFPTEADAVTVLDRADLPTDYSFRNAWVMTGGKPDVDMGRAKEIQRERLRSERAPLLKALDVEVSRALVAKDDAKIAELEAERQRLRDVTALPSIDAAQTPDDLKAIRAQDRPSK